VIVIDDGSTDDTAERAAEAGAVVVEQRPNQGKGAAVRAGLRRALAEGAVAVVTLDADGQHDPAEIPRLLEAYRRTDADLVIGRRDFSRMPPVRRLSNTLGTAAFSWTVGRAIPDNQSGFRLLGRALAERIAGGGEPGFEYDVEMIVTAIRDGLRIEWVPISTIYGAPSHIRPWRHLTSFVRMLRVARREARRQQT